MKIVYMGTPDFAVLPLKALIDKGYDVVYGARPLKRYIQNTLENNLARKIIKGDVHYGSNVVVDGENDELTLSTR